MSMRRKRTPQKKSHVEIRHKVIDMKSPHKPVVEVLSTPIKKKINKRKTSRCRTTLSTKVKASPKKTPLKKRGRARIISKEKGSGLIHCGKEVNMIQTCLLDTPTKPNEQYIYTIDQDRSVGKSGIQLDYFKLQIKSNCN